MRISALDRKLLRDLLGMKGQAVAIGAVLASGVAMYVAYLSNFDSLQRTRAAYYDRFRFADAFASCKRAPLRLEERLREIPGVSAVDTRTVVEVTFDVPDAREPLKGRLIGIPGEGRPRLDDLSLRRGRWIAPGRDDEVLLNEPFGRKHNLLPGTRFAALINGSRRTLTVVGHALSPEYVYVLPPGEVIPDDSRYGIAWMERRALAAAFDMEGGFNDVALKVMPGASAEEVILQADRLLTPWGGLGAVPRRLQTSHWALDNELEQLQSFGFLVPAIFLGVAAFLLNVAMARILAVQRPQIAALKALGYSNAAIGWHYVKWGLVIAGAGGIGGVAIGAWIGAEMLDLYNLYFRFPILLYRLSGSVVVTALLIGLAAATLGAVFAVRRAVRIPPAEAMRPEPPARYRASFLEIPAVSGRLGLGTRMVLRNVARQPWRSAATVMGIAFAVGILFFGFILFDVMDMLAKIQFSLVQRQDLTVSFVEPRSARALGELRSLPGVLAVEPFRSVPARLRFGHRSRQLAITGQLASPDLSRVVALSGEILTLPPEGIVISKVLGDVLGAREGDRVTIEVLEGARPVREARVARLVDDYMGLSAYMEKVALHRMMREGDSLSGAHLLVDSSRLDALYRRLQATPAVAGIAITEKMLASFRSLMAETFTIMTALNVVFAAVIACGVVYNAARISLSERSRELASLRVLGFTIGEISLVLLGELALLTLLAIPPGLLVGRGIAKILLLAFQNEVYRLPLVVTPQNATWSALVVIVAASASALAVRRRLDRLDLVAVLKTRE